MRHTLQANRVNPAFMTDYKVTVTLPGVYNNLRVSNFTYGDLLIEGDNGRTILSPNAVINQLDETGNIVRTNLDIETLGLGLRFNKLGLNLTHTLRSHAYLNYPKALPQLIWQGNAQFIGETVNFAPQLALHTYHEIALGAIYDITPNFSIGAKAKLLSGQSALHTAGNRLQLTTSNDVYQLNLNADYTVNSAGSLSYEGLEDAAVDLDFGSVQADRLFSQDRGVAFDLGARFAFDKFEVTASVLDLGGTINWEEEVNNYRLSGDYTFEGLEFASDILEDSTEFGSVLDTLEAIYDFEETRNGFSTDLPTRVYIGINYELLDNWDAGILFYTENYLGETYPAVAVGSNVELADFVNLGATYAFRTGTFDNIGLNATFQLGPVQLLAATDNIITAFRPEDSNSAHFRLGLNLQFGQLEEDR